MYYVLIAAVLVTLTYLGWRLAQSAGGPQTRVTGPDDDPDFLRRIGKDNPSGF